jgi:hypothetical protein
MMTPSIVSVARSGFRMSARKGELEREREVHQASASSAGSPASAVAASSGAPVRLVGDEMSVLEDERAREERGDVGLVRHQHDRQPLLTVELLEQRHDLERGAAVEIARSARRQG